MNLFCPDSSPTLFGLFDTSIAPTLLFYSYIPIVFISIFFGIYILVKDRFSILSKLLFTINFLFTAWIICALVAWIGVHANIVHLSWQIIIFFEVGIFLCSVYFAHAYAHKEDLNIRQKSALALLITPIIILLPTKYNIAYFDLVECEGVIGHLWDYAYVVEIISIISILFIYYRVLKNSQDKKLKREMGYLTAGMAFFLILLSTSAFFSDLTGVYQIELIGPIGMSVFLAFLTFMIVRFRVFNIRLIGAQALVATLVALIFAILFIRHIENVRIVTLFTLGLVIVLGSLLVKGVKREIETKEKLQHLTDSLEKANERLKELDQQKSEFVSLASHQLRGPLTAIKGYASLLLEGDFGEVKPEVKEVVETIFKSTQSLVVIVGDYLDVSRIEQGRMKYDFVDFDLRSLAETIIEEMEPNTKLAKLEMKFNCDPDGNFMINADQGKIKQVISNIIDNSIKYTKKGGIDVSLERKDSKLLISIKDTGVGIPAEVIPRLFEKFTRAPDASKTNIMGTGLGLYVAKKMIEAHKGRIWAESEGKDKGSTFFIELEAKNK